MSSPMQKSTLSSERRSRARHHPCGTCRMGSWDDPMAVVDADQHVIGLQRTACGGFVDYTGNHHRKPKSANHHDRREGGRSHSRGPPAPATFKPAMLPVARLGEGTNTMTAKNTQQGASDQGQSGSPRRRLPSRASPDSRRLQVGFLPTRLLKSAIGAQVVGLFKDQSRREKPATRRADGLFGPHSVAWRVHGDKASMLVGGIAALLLQMLHPAVLAGVWDHSKFPGHCTGDCGAPHSFSTLTTYGGQAVTGNCDAARASHPGIQDCWRTEPRIAQNDPSLLAGVHVTKPPELSRRMDTLRRTDHVGSGPGSLFHGSCTDRFGTGRQPGPQSRAEADDVVQLMKPCLLCDGRTRQIARLVLTEPAPSIVLKPLRLITTQAALELLPGWARCMPGMSEPGLDWLVRASAFGVAQTLRWITR